MLYFVDIVPSYDSDFELSLNCTYSTDGYYLIPHHAQAIFCMCMCEPAVPCQSWPAGMSGVGHWYRGLKKLFLDLLPVQSHLLSSHLFCVFPLSSLMSFGTRIPFLLLRHLHSLVDSFTTFWHSPHCFSLSTHPWFHESLCPLPCQLPWAGSWPLELQCMALWFNAAVNILFKWHPTFTQEGLFVTLVTVRKCIYNVLETVD